MNIKLVAIDLAKRSFQLCGISITGKVVFNQKLSRAQLLKRLVELSPTTGGGHGGLRDRPLLGA